MALGFAQTTRSSARPFGQRHRVLPDAESVVRPGLEAEHRVGGEHIEDGRTGLAGTGLYDTLPASEDIGRIAWGSAK